MADTPDPVRPEDLLDFRSDEQKAADEQIAIDYPTKVDKPVTDEPVDAAPPQQSSEGTYDAAITRADAQARSK